ncbi:sodium:proton antiporter [Lactobacillus sp.]|uniref:cation:proton antiporter n=1 Tax=Lactobacillus sp. TaxID=1591 RepID=UPI00198CAF10|nr:sodium:proton antiporter [Lactobacillus sp.]MBD5430678.1 sodium:proton antiporter [Lactobacillus sp.]
MELMTSTFTLVMAAAISIIIAQAIDRISVNYISMFVGVVIGLIPILNHHVAAFDTEIFMELIIAPLLFFEGQKTRVHNIRRSLKAIIGITVLMVLLAVITAGFSIHWITGVGIAMSFIISSISAPTDATATESVTNNLKVPRKIAAALKSESLFNDASGIILLNMAVLWFENGHVNYGQTIRDFLISSVGGAAVGAIIAVIIIIIRQILVRSKFNSLNAQNLIYILTPIVIYAISEHVGVSGIIAVVVAGLMHNAEAQYSVLLNSRQVHMGRDLEGLISEIFNSMVFVILGLMLVRIGRTRIFNSDVWRWITVGIIIYLANLLIRYLYSRLFMHFSKQEASIFSFGGVHGAVTLALALTLSSKFLGQDNYNLVMISEAVLILLSMIIPTIIFPFMLEHKIDNQDALIKVDKIRNEMVKKAIFTIHRMYLPRRVKRQVIFTLMTQKQAINTRQIMHAIIRTIDQPNLSDEEIYLQRLAFMRAFTIEREFLEMIGQKDARYRTYILKLYNEVLLAESLIITENED